MGRVRVDFNILIDGVPLSSGVVSVDRALLDPYVVADRHEVYGGAVYKELRSVFQAAMREACEKLEEVKA